MPVLNGTDIRYLRGIASGEKADQAASAVARRFAKEYDIGRLISGRIVFSPEDAGRAAGILTKAAIPITPQSEPLTRAEAALLGLPSEKSGSRPPYQGAVLIHALNDGVTADGRPIAPMPGFTHLVDIKIANQIQCDIVLWVENLETFRRLHRYAWIPRNEGSVLAVYRGDTHLNVATSTEVLKGRPRVWLFIDYDPAGMVIADTVATRTPVERVMVPSTKWLESNLSRIGRPHLFHQQRASWSAASGAQHRDLKMIWGFIEQCQKGLPQEATELFGPTWAG